MANGIWGEIAREIIFVKIVMLSLGLFLLFAGRILQGVRCCEGIRVHVIPHSHDDPGWIKTFEQYYQMQVRDILDSAVTELRYNKNRTFVYSETAFFEKWWREQDDDTRTQVKQLVTSKQLQFVNGGWCMHDEATTHYNAVIDQMTLGLRFIQETFGREARPRVGWQLDPFGHSAELASLSSLMSFDALFFQRIDADDKKKRKTDQRMEMLWRGSRDYDQNTQIFAGVFFDRYMPPKGFCFDVSRGWCDDRIRAVSEDAERFEKEVCLQAKAYRTNNLMILMGADFSYTKADTWYSNIEKLITELDKRGKVKAFYSSPWQYLKDVQDSGFKWEVETGDFFPYADEPAGCYWTGYFTSRPTFKRYVRESNNILQACKQLESVTKERVGYSSDSLKRAMALNQHHDAITGTQKQFVADDYVKMTYAGRRDCQEVLSNAVNTAAKSNFKWERCDNLNISVCTSQQQNLSINIYNPVARTVSAYLRIPVYAQNITIHDPHGKELRVDYIKLSEKTLLLQKDLESNTVVPQYEATFSVEIPPLGFSTLSTRMSDQPSKVLESSSDRFIENKYLRLDFSESGELEKLSRKDTNLSVSFDQSFIKYAGMSSNRACPRANGAYIFSSSKATELASTDLQTKVFKGVIVQEIRQTINAYVERVIRLYNDTPYLEFEHTVGPLLLQCDVVTRFATDIKNAGIFYTDANGREMKQRVRDFRATWNLTEYDKISQNYYPVTSAIMINDTGTKLVVLTDRSQGGTSGKAGEVEFMLHRRSQEDDGLGVEEALDEGGTSGEGLIIRGVHRVMLLKNKEMFYRHHMEQLAMQPLLSFADSIEQRDTKNSSEKLKHSFLNFDLPSNIRLLSLERLSESEVLVRLENFFESSEDVRSTTFSVRMMFKPFKINSVRETNLVTNQSIDERSPLQWSTKDNVDNRQQKTEPLGPELSVTLEPMHIRTFILNVSYYP